MKRKRVQKAFQTDIWRLIYQKNQDFSSKEKGMAYAKTWSGDLQHRRWGQGTEGRGERAEEAVRIAERSWRISPSASGAIAEAVQPLPPTSP